MTATVLPFARPNAQGAREKAEDTRTASDIDRRAFISELREALSPRTGRVKLLRKLRRDEDAVLLAQRLGSDLERVKKLERGVLSKTLERAGLKLTTRARYALFAGDAVTAKRVRKLQPYVALADAVAESLRQDADLFLYEKLVGINLVEAEQTSDDEATKLGLLLTQMAKAVAEQTGLNEFFDLAARTPGMMDEWGNFQPSTMNVLRDRAHEDGFDHWTEQQPIPSVPVCRILEQTLHGRARIAPWTKMSSRNLPKLVQAVDGKPSGETLEIAVEIWREIGLAIGERYQQGATGPMFSGRAQIKVLIDGVIATPFYPWTLEHFFSDQPALLVDHDRWTACRAELDLDDEFSDAWVEPSPPPGNPSYAVEHYYFSKHPVNAWTLRHLLDRSEGEVPNAESLLPEVAADNRPDAYRFRGQIGQRFEAALFSGVLESALSADVARLKDRLNRYVTERRGKFAAQDDVMMARWKAVEHADADGPEEG
jgi:hypothetical protein